MPAAISFSDIKIDPSVPREDETAWKERLPAADRHAVHGAERLELHRPRCHGIDFICWPTVAASSIEVYMPKTRRHSGLGELADRHHAEARLDLPHSAGRRWPAPCAGRSSAYFQSENRFRDTAIGPDRKTIYVATDPGGLAESRSGGVTNRMQNPGAILVFTYAGGGSGAVPGGGKDPHAAGTDHASAGWADTTPGLAAAR